MAGCVLGGGSAINAGLWFKPQRLDWDTQFPHGWKAEDLSAATDRAFQRVPWTNIPSKDGILYNREANDLITKGLVENGWTSVEANNEPDAKRRTVSQSEYFFQHGGIGPKDQLEVVQTAEGDALVDSAQWIDLPVGYNLDDHVNVILT
ncbi:uncharacterized protein N0V96_004496 [Colletotrichum fioriniae]|uniref:uncharacterized protein n=1 Tax=Colletotrichum fioriniae TaxID=710243 RepID=UPI0032DA96AC|nr:hypothetical protein N0V96_004496 [Colletotrichum fioriniae]